MDLSVIIVSYNTFDLTKEAIESVLQDEGDLKIEIVVVDNNSPDQSGPRLEMCFPPESNNVRVISLPDNKGFAGGNNLGAQYASGSALLFLNPDTLVLPGSLEKLTQACKVDGTGAVGPRVYNPDGTDQKSVAPLPNLGSLARHYLPISALFRPGLQQPVHVPDDLASVDVIKGCAIAMRRDVFEQVGGWDESYFLYSEESELCFQIKKLGYSNRFIRTAEIIHYGQASVSKENYAEQQIVQNRSVRQYLMRHSSSSVVFMNRILGAVGFGIRAVVLSALGQLGHNEMHLRAQAARRLFRFFIWEYDNNV